MTNQPGHYSSPTPSQVTGNSYYRYIPESNTTIPSADVSKEVIYSIFLLNGFISFIGVLGNIFVCLIIIRGRKMYTIANLFLMNLAIADVCVLLISYPLWVIKTLSGTWPFGAALCKIVLSVSDAFYGVSLGCMTTISIHRYRMILHAMSPQLTFFQAKLIIIFIWFISLGTISVPLYPVLKYIKNHDKYQCGSQWPNKTYERSYQIFLTVVWYVLPLLIILCTFLRIRYYLRKQMQYEWMQSSRQNILVSNHIRGIKKALRMLAPVVIVFTILMFPWNFLRMLSVFKFLPEIPNNQLYIFIAGTMLIANSVVNPFIYYIMSVEFRIEFRKQLWLVKRWCGFKNIDDEYTIEYDRSGRTYVRRLESVAASEYHCNGNSKMEYKRRLSSASHRHDAHAHEDRNDSFVKERGKTGNGIEYEDNKMNEIFCNYRKLANGKSLRNEEKPEEYDLNSNTLTNCLKSSAEETINLLSVDLPYTAETPSDTSAVCESEIETDVNRLYDGELDMMRETIL